MLKYKFRKYQPAIGICMYWSEVNVLHCWVLYKIWAEWSCPCTRVDPQFIASSRPIKSFKPNCDKVLLIQALDVRRHFSNPSLLKKSNLKIRHFTTKKVLIAVSEFLINKWLNSHHILRSQLLFLTEKIYIYRLLCYLKKRARWIGYTSRLIHELPSKYGRFIRIFDSTVRISSS